MKSHSPPDFHIKTYIVLRSRDSFILLVMPYPSFTSKYHNAPYPEKAEDFPAHSASGEVIAIAGGGRGIGKAIAVSFARASASTIILLGRTESSLKSTQVEILSTFQKS